MSTKKIGKFSLDERQVVQGSSRIEFPISSGIGLATRSVIKYL